MMKKIFVCLADTSFIPPITKTNFILMRLFILSILLFLSFALYGQKSGSKEFQKTPEMIYSYGQKYNSWSISAGFGPVFMYADQSGYSLIPNQKIDFGPSFWVTKQVLPALGVEFQYLNSQMHGQEGMYAFDGDLQDISLNGVVFLNHMTAYPGPINDHWNYYLKIGVGTTLYRSRLLHSETGEFVRRSELYGTANPDYVVLGYDDSQPDSKTSREVELVVPFGFGVMYRINSSFDVGVESVLRFSAVDKLDNILTGASNDRYLFTAINLSYKFGEKEGRRHLRWTYRSEGMDLFGRTMKDPLADEVRNLAEDITYYEANRPVHKDSVVIVETLKVIYDQYNVRTLFFTNGKTETFSPLDQRLMGEVAVELQNSPQKKIYLYGYADINASDDQNMEVSRERCDAVKNVFVEQFDVDPTRIEVLPQGNTDLLSPVEELTPRGLQMVNQRVDIVVK
jgi:outer membrane protein OmpA-like peptidoglycan-associated protein